MPTLINPYWFVPGGTGPPLSPFEWWDPDLGAWQDVAGTTAATATNDPVARLDGQTGSYGNLTNSAGTTRPLLTASGVNGHGYLLFDGSNDFLSIVSALNKPITVVMAVYTVTWTDLAEFFGNTSAARGRLIMHSTTPGIELQVADILGSQNNGLAAATWGIVSCRFSNNTSVSDSVRVNNNARTVLSGSASSDWSAAFQGLSFGKAYNLSPSNIRLGRIAVYSSQLSQGDEDTVVSSFITYYGV